MRPFLAAALVALALWQTLDVHLAARQAGSVETWRQDLRSAEAPLRRRAALRLGAARDAASLEALTRALADPDRTVRELAVWSLGRLGDPRPVPALCSLALEALAGEQEQFPVYVVSSLGALEDPRAIPTLQAVVARTEDTGLREDALRALGRIGTEEARLYLETLLCDLDENVRAVALRQLAGMGPLAPRALQAVASDRAQEVQQAAAEALGGHPEARPLLEALARAGDPEVRSQAARALTQRYAARNRDLARRFPEPPPEILDLPVDDVVAANLEDYHPVEHGPLAMGLPRDPEDLARQLAEGSAEEKCNAALLLGNRSEIPDSALDALRRAADDPDAGVRWSALKALGKQGDQAFMAGMLKAVRDPDKDVREDAVEALGRLGGSVAEPVVKRALREALHDEAPTVRLQALYAMQRVFPDHRDDLEGLGDDPNAYVRRQARKALL